MAFVHPSSRYRLYFDETGTGDLKAHRKDQNQRYLSLTGVVIRQDNHDAVATKHLDDLKLNVFGTKDIVLHRREIIDAKGKFEVLKQQGVRAKFDTGFLDIVHGLPKPAFTVSIDKQEHFEKYKVWQFSPYHYVLTCLLERYALFLHYAGFTGDVMGEARNPKDDAQLRRAFRYFYDNGTTVRPDVIQRCLISRELKLVPKTDNVAAVQIADLLAHPAHRAYKFERLKIAQPQDYGTTVAKILLDKTYHRSWTGRIEGYGRKRL